MLIESTSEYYLKRTRAASKEIEFEVSEELRAKKEGNIVDLFPLAIAMISDISTGIIRGEISIKNIKNFNTELDFVSKFFDSYLILEDIFEDQIYLSLIGSVSYYINDQIGSSIVLANKIKTERFRLSQSQIELLIQKMLTNDENSEIIFAETNPYKAYMVQIDENYKNVIMGKANINFKLLNKVRSLIYSSGEDRDLMFIDILYALFILKKEYSIFNLLPMYSVISKKDLLPIIQSNHLIKELWPSQREMCMKGLFNDISGVIQLPTGAGKTKAISISIYTMFKKYGTGLSIIVLPFRALCREVSDNLTSDLSFDSSIHINTLSDLIQVDYYIEELFKPEWKSIIVTTPEKLAYLLNHDRSVLLGIKQIIFDEGHLFDDNSRGAKYELLLASILNEIDESVQKIFISAIIPNVVDVNNWLTSGQGTIIRGMNSSSVEKLTSILQRKGKYYSLCFLNNEDYDVNDYYIPRLLETFNLVKLPKETAQRVFPDIREKNDFAIACLLQVIKNATGAIFCAKKTSVDKIIRRVIDLHKRGFDISSLQKNVSISEIRKISRLIKENYGENNDYYLSSQFGCFIHHGGISEGIKNSIEYALRKLMINNVICTSTLAQGVNLPIRYLIVSSLYQSDEIIKVRDFHNLIGRTGRPGIFTEGTIILSDPCIKDDDYKWYQYKRLLNQSNSEICNSKILELVTPIELPKRRSYTFTDIILSYYKESECSLDIFKLDIKNAYKIDNRLGQKFEEACIRIVKTLNTLENYISSLILDDEIDEVFFLENTLAYTMASDEQRKDLLEIVEYMSVYLKRKLSSTENKNAYINSMLSLNEFLIIEKAILTEDDWLIPKFDVLVSKVMKIIFSFSDNKNIRNIESLSDFIHIAKMWMNGSSYQQILESTYELGMKINFRKRFRNYKLSEIISICDNGFGYSSSVLVNCICEIISKLGFEFSNTIYVLEDISRMLKYGLPSQSMITIYEYAFNDRVISQKIHDIIGDCEGRIVLIENLKSKKTEISKLLNSYPSVFSEKLKEL